MAQYYKGKYIIAFYALTPLEPCLCVCDNAKEAAAWLGKGEICTQSSLGKVQSGTVHYILYRQGSVVMRIKPYFIKVEDESANSQRGISK